MLYAIATATQEKVRAIKDRSATYTCQMCSEAVIPRCGQIKAWHFAHKVDSVCEASRYGMTDWHYEWQMLFPEQDREVVVIHDGVKHRADVLQNRGGRKIVFEFQRKMMPLDEMLERENFWKKNGYTFFWVFDCTKISSFDDDNWFQLLKQKTTNGYSFKWRHAPKTIAELEGEMLCDIGDGEVMYIKNLYMNKRPYYGYGNMMKRQSLLI